MDTAEKAPFFPLINIKSTLYFIIFFINNTIIITLIRPTIIILTIITITTTIPSFFQSYAVEIVICLFVCYLDPLHRLMNLKSTILKTTTTILKTTTTSKTKTTTKTKSENNTMHGDLVNAICYTAFLPVYGYLWYQESTNLVGARNVNISFLWTMVFSWISYWTKSEKASILAITGMTVSIAFMNLYGWPHADQVVVEPQFLWSLLIISGNRELSYIVKLALGCVALSGATVVAVKSPLVDVMSVLPTLLGAFAVYCVFHYLFTQDSRKLVSAHGASILLAGSFAFHITSEITKIISTPGYGKSGGYSILIAGFFAVVGFFSSMAFQEEIYLNGRLEAAVKERTREVEYQAKRLVVVEHALQASDTGIAVLDSDYSILWSNKAIKDLMKLESNLGTGRMFETFKLAKDNNTKVADDHHHTSTVTELKLGDKSVSLEISKFPGYAAESIDTKEGEEPSCEVVKRYLLVMKDITAIRAREAAERAAEQESTQSKAMQEAMQNLSHELRTPLQGIMGMTSLMIGNEGSTWTAQEVRETMTMVMTSSRLLLTLINNMLDVQKLNANMLGEFALTSCQLSTILKAASDFCLPLAAVHEMSMKIHYGENDCNDDIDNTIVKTNSLRLQQVVINLLSNAIKYSPTRGSISIRVRRQDVQQVKRSMANALSAGTVPDSWKSSSPTKNNTSNNAKRPLPPPVVRQLVVVTVSDEGNGIPVEKAGELFRRFASNWSSCPRLQGDNTKEEPFGTGLGLNLCKRFVERMNGAIWVNNNVNGKGASFSFALDVESSTPTRARSTTTTTNLPNIPVSVQNGGQIAAENLSKQITLNNGVHDNNSTAATTTTAVDGTTQTSVGSIFPIQNHRILVVDDVRMNLKVSQRMLSSLGVTNVDTALSGQEALELIKQSHSSSNSISSKNSSLIPAGGKNQQQPYTIVISDLQMPNMSGLELSRAINGLDICNRPFIVGFTADTGPEVVAACHSSGMNDILFKPTTKEELRDLLVRIGKPSSC